MNNFFNMPPSSPTLPPPPSLVACSFFFILLCGLLKATFSVRYQGLCTPFQVEIEDPLSYSCNPLRLRSPLSCLESCVAQSPPLTPTFSPGRLDFTDTQKVAASIPPLPATADNSPHTSSPEDTLAGPLLGKSSHSLLTLIFFVLESDPRPSS